MTHLKIHETKYQLPVIQLIYKFVKNIKETNTVEKCITEIWANYMGNEHKAPLLSVDRRTSHESHDDLQLPTHMMLYVLTTETKLELNPTTQKRRLSFGQQT